jgi:hypothetical protein
MFMRYACSAAFAALFVFILRIPAAGQSPVTAIEPPAIGSAFDAGLLRDLPLGDNLYALAETTQAEVISDRFNSGGLNTGGPSRLGGFLGSWSQTLFRIGDLNVSDPNGGGEALIFPEAMLWERLRVDTGLMPAGVNAPGLALTLEPRRASTVWTGFLAGSGSGGSLVAGAPDDQPPPIARLDQHARGAALVSGPLTEGLGLAAGGTWAGSRSFHREREPSSRNTLVSGFAHLTLAASAHREWRAFAWVQRAERPFQEWLAFQDPASATRDTAVHVQSTWEERPSAGWRWRVFGGFTQRARAHEFGVPAVVMERLSAGSVPAVVDEAAGRTARRLAGGLRLAPSAVSASRHQLEFGVDVDTASTTVRDQFAGTVHELIDGLRERIWNYTVPQAESRRGAITAAGYVADTLALSPAVTFDASLRAEVVHGRAEDAETAVDWISLLPSARIRWLFAERRRLALVGGYARSANTLNLNWLAHGDPAAPVARVAAASRPAVLVARVGPGTGGVPSFSQIDEDLRRPYTDEFVVGLDAGRIESMRFTLTGIARREGNLVAVVNTGVPMSGYSTIEIPDEYIFLRNPEDDRILTVFNRLPSTFGRDTYLLTNPELDAAHTLALKLTAERASERLFILFGATAYLSEGSGGNRGYGPRENDQDAPGELFANPNAATYARGRLFTDRGFTIKWTTLYRMPYDVTLGAIARYQDGQPFSRMVVVRDLSQGAEAVRAYPSGGTRFTFTGTLDLRVQKGFRIGTSRLDVIVDAYNLLTRSNEVEEYVVTGPAFRTSTAIQPPHSVHLGARVTF